MLFFINPITNLVDSLSQEKALTKAYLGLFETMAQPITNSVGEFRFYYNRFLSYLIWHLENTIASVEQANVQMESKTTIPKSTPANAPIEIDVNVPREVDIENPTDIGVEEQVSDEKATAPTEEAKTLIDEQAQTSSTSQPPEIEVGETEEDEEDWPIPEPTPNKNSEVSIEESIAILLECETKLQLMSKKKEIGEELVKKAWDTMTLIQKNYLQLISLRDNVTKPFATLGYQLAYQPTKDVKPRSSRLIGFYLHGEKLPQADERAILVDGETEPTICSKAHLRPLKNSTPVTETEIKFLEKLLSEPQESEPTAETVAANTFTGLVPSPKLNSGSETGSKPELPPSEPSVGVQTELNLQPPEPKELPPTSTPALEVIASELKRFHPQNTLTFTYLTTPRSTFLTIKHGDSQVACFEDDGSDIYEVGNNKLTFHGFTSEQISKAYDAGEAVLESLKQKKA